MKSTLPILVSSNENKIAEFRRFGLKFDVQKGADIKEVDGDMDEVIIHKSISAGVNKIVEDTILVIEGEEIVDIRYRINEFSKNSYAEWVVSLGYNDGVSVRVYRGVIKGRIIKTKDISGFGFDSYFIPEGSDKTLSELDKIGEKDSFSARKIAVYNLLKDKYVLKININDIKNWNGKFQNESTNKTSIVLNELDLKKIVRKIIRKVK